MTPGKNIYPFLILLLLGSFLCFSFWSAKQAADSGPEVTDADYYSKGLKYSSTVLEKRAAAALGWNVSTKLNGRTLEFHLSDKAGNPVSGARGIIFLYLPGTKSSTELPLQEIAAGTYIFNLTNQMTGELSARVEFGHKSARINRHMLINL